MTTVPQIVCRNWRDDRVIPRFVRHLSNGLNWPVGERVNPAAEVNYLLAYFEHQLNTGYAGKLISYMTHREENEGAKTRLYDQVAARSDVRVAMNAAEMHRLGDLYGPTVQIPLPLELDHFRITAPQAHKIPVIGLSGYTYKSGRKGEDLAARLFEDSKAGAFTLTASGRGWPCKTKMYSWADLPSFFQSLDLYVCVALVEGGPMTTLESLACGVPVVIPEHVGLHDELPETRGIYRYERGNYDALIKAVNRAIKELGTHEKRDLREATQPHSVKAWVDGHAQMMDTYFAHAPRTVHKAVKIAKPKNELAGNCGVYVVAFGDQAREIVLDCIDGVHKHMPGVPVALCSDRALGPEDILIQKPDADIGGRIAKLKCYEYAPREWEYILYLDADIEVAGDLSLYFQVLHDGWEFVICKDAHLHETMRSFERSNNRPEHEQTLGKIGTSETLQINGGAWSFRRCQRTMAFFDRWFKEWSEYKGRDQGALIRALYDDPLKVYWLFNEWNTLITLKGEEYPPGVAGTAGAIHRIGKARRWTGQIQGGLDSPQAWAAVEAYKQRAAQKAKSK